MNMGNIYLVGFMGTGKTSVGKELARSKKWNFIDLDDLIELRQGRSIQDIFSKEGEPYFRRLEKRTLKDVAKEKKFVVACGGGIVIDEENIRIMKETGIIICLSGSPEVILQRTKKFTHRPLLNVDDPKKQIELLLKMRSPFYAKADRIIDTSKLSVKETANKILKILSRKAKE